MKQRSMILVAAAVMPFAVAAAQTPPAPPVAQAPATPVVPLTPLTPMAPLPAQSPVVLYPDYIDREAIRRMVDDAKWQGQIAAEEGRRIADEARRIAEDAKWQIKGQMADFKFDFDHDFKVNLEHLKDFQVVTPKVSVSVPGFAYAPQAQQGNLLWMPGQQQQWQDPADSAYEVAQQAFQRQDYSRAAARFADMIAKFPNSRRVPQAAYYQAFALYRVGTLESLRSAQKVLEANEQRFAYGYNSSLGRTDAPALQARVLRALADRNEGGADGKLRELIAKYPAVSCDNDKIQIQRDVLNSLYQTDPESAMPYITQYLRTRDACTATLRQTAIFLLANRGTPENTSLIVQLAKGDTVRSVRMRAVEVLSRMPGDAAIEALQQFMTDDDEQIQAAAVRSLMRSDNPKARAAMRTLIDRRDASERQRTEAIRSFDRDNTSPEDAAYLRGLFNRAGESDRVKEAVISALAQVPTDENMKFLMDVAQNQNESSSIRSRALSRVTSRQNLTTDNLIKLYDATDNRSMRLSLVEALGQRPEPAAVNKLLNIVQYSTDPEVRGPAIRTLLNKNDKTITQKVLDLIK